LKDALRDLGKLQQITAIALDAEEDNGLPVRVRL
jgi:hypothetical protein